MSVYNLMVKIGADASSLTKGLAESTKELTKAVKETTSKVVKTVETNIKDLEKTARDYVDTTSKLVDSNEALVTATEEAGAAIIKAEDAAESFTDTASGAVAATGKLGGGFAGLAESAKAAGEKMTKLGKDLSFKLTTPIAALGTVAAKSAIDFESAFAGVRKTVDATEAQYAELEKGIRDMAKTIPASATAIASVAEAAGQLGIERENILGFSRVMIDLGESTNLSADEAATSLARLANITQMPQDQFDKLGSTVVALGNSMATTEAEIVAMGLRLAGAGKQIGLSEAQILSFGGALSSVGIEAEAGGTAFSKVFKDIFTATKTGSKSLETFAQVAGMTTAQFKQQFETDAAGAIISFIEGLGKIGAQGGNTIAILEKLNLSDIRVSDSLLRASGAGDLFRRSMETGTKAWQENTALTKEAEERYKTLASVLARTKNYLADLAITFGQDMMPTIREVAGHVRALVERFAALDSETRRNIIIAGAFVAAAGPLLVVFGTLASSVVSIITLYGKLVPLFAAGSKGAALMAGSIKALGVAMRFMMGPLGLLITGLTTLTALTVKANQSMQTVLDNQAATFDKTGKAVSEATAIYAKFAKGATLTAEEAKKGALGLRLLAAEATNPNVKKGLLEKASALQKVVEESKKATQTTGTVAPAPIIDVDAILAGAGDAAKAIKPIEDSVKAAELSFQGLYARFRQIDTEAKHLGTGAIDVLRQKIQALEGQIKDSLAFTGPMTGAQQAALDQAVKSLGEYRQRLTDAEAAQKALGKTTVADVLGKLSTDLETASNRAALLGDGFDVGAERSQIFRRAIEDLAELGVKPGDEAMQALSAAAEQAGVHLSNLTKEAKKPKSAMEALQASVSDVLASVNGLRDGLSTIISAFGDYTENAVLGAVAAMGNFAMAGVQVWTSVGTLIPQLYSMGVAMHASLGPIGLVTGAIALLAAGISFLINRQDEEAKKAKEAAEATYKAWQESVQKISETFQTGFASSIGDTLKRYFSGDKINFLKELTVGIREAVIDGMIQALVQSSIIEGKMGDLMKQLSSAVAAGNTGLVNETIAQIKQKLPEVTSFLEDAAGKLRGVIDFQLPDPGSKSAPQAPDLTSFDAPLPEPPALPPPPKASPAPSVGDTLGGGGPVGGVLDWVVQPIHWINDALNAIWPFADGGIVTGPTLGMIGEAGDNEAVLPLNDATFESLGAAIANAMREQDGGKGQGVTVNVVIHAGASLVDEASLDQWARVIGIRLNNLRMQAL